MQVLREQNRDLEEQLHLVSEKIIDKSDEYQSHLGDLEHQLDKTQREYQQQERDYEFIKSKQNEMKTMRSNEITQLNQYSKCAD